MSAEAFGNAVRFRMTVGLRADEAWILDVADDADTDGQQKYGTPLTTQEVAELDARAADAEAILPVVQEYGSEHEDAFAGTYVDTVSGRVIARFASSVEVHRAQLARLVRPGAPLDVRSADWTLSELTARQRQVEADLEWLFRADAWFAGAGVDLVRNRVLLKLSSANPEAVRLGMEHYDGGDWLIVESDGVGRWDGPLGNLTIDAVTRSGAPARFLDCVLVPDDPSAAHTVGDYGTGDSGRCAIEGIAATTYLLELRMLPPDGSPWVVVGSTRVGVPALQTESITVPVDLP